MIISYSNDGCVFNPSIAENGFSFNIGRDVKIVNRFSDNGEKTDIIEPIFDFVGFETNDNNDLFVSFPKRFRVKKVEDDAKLLFLCIGKYAQKRAADYFGDNPSEEYVSNYPFSAFFEIYDYYSKYGVYLAHNTINTTEASGKINWKRTIDYSEKYWFEDRILPFPLHRDKKNYYTNIISDCMIFAINYTIDKFALLFSGEYANERLIDFDFLGNRSAIVNLLLHFKQNTFIDKDLILINALIDFYSNIKLGGTFYLKHYNFESIWEDMVRLYLNAFFEGVSDKGVIIGTKKHFNTSGFSKLRYYSNAAKENQYIEPDYMYFDDKGQYIFDAKYYTKINGMNYKQIAYVYMLRGQKDKSGGKRFPATYSALLLPSEERKSIIHFKSCDSLTDAQDKILISEEYLSIRDVMDYYVHGSDQ